MKKRPRKIKRKKEKLSEEEKKVLQRLLAYKIYDAIEEVFA